MRRVLVFGSTGFIGTQVCHELAADAELIRPRRTDCDLVTAGVDDLAGLLRETAPTAVVCCVGLLDGPGSAMVAAHALATAKLIEAVAAAAPRARLVRLGSAGEYGPVPFGHPVGEDHPTGPISAYGLSHLTGTRLVEHAVRAGRVDAVSLRVFNPIGPGLSRATVLGAAATAMTHAAREGHDRIVLGPLDAYRDFVDVRDVGRAVAATVRAERSPGAVVNVGSGNAVPVRSVVRTLAQVLGFGGDVREEESSSSASRSAGVPWMCADIRRAADLLGWRPTHDLPSSVHAYLSQWCGSSASSNARHVGDRAPAVIGHV